MERTGWIDSKKYAAITVVIVLSVSSIVGLFIVTNPSPSNGNTSSSTSTFTTKPPPDEDDPYSFLLNEIMDLDNMSYFTDYEVDFDIDAPSYTLDAGLANVINIDGFSSMDDWGTISDKIEENYFALLAGQELSYPSRPYQQFSEVYDENFWDCIPSFVTVDAMYHTFHVLYDEALRTMEMNNLTIHLDLLLTHLIEVSTTQYDSISDMYWKTQAKKNIAFFSIAKKCLKPSWSPPTLVSDWVSTVMDLISDADGFNTQWFMHQNEDFSQYKPRGHYTRSEELKQFFKSMMWLGRINLRTYPEDLWLSLDDNNEKGQNETAQALLMCEAMKEGSSVLNEQIVYRLWKLIYMPTAFFVGESDDLTPLEYDTLATSIYGVNYTLADIVDNTTLNEFREAAQELRDPRILSDFMMEFQSMENVTKGMALFGQRFIPDSYIFWELVHPNVPNRYFPAGLDVMNVFGSDRAAEILSLDMGNPNYVEQLEKLQNEFFSLNQANWTQNLYWLWLYSIIPILERYDDNYPSFMSNTAWYDKSLITALGSWTELRHDTILYAKQSYTGYYSTVNPPSGYVEPVPNVYARLASLCRMMLDGLDQRYLLGTDIRNRLMRLLDLLVSLRDISIKELTSTQLSDEDDTLLKHIGTTLKYLETRDDDDVDRSALITDVHTDTNTDTVLEEATGNPMVILIAVPTYNSTVFLARGAVYSYYEFTQPKSDRLTDEAWWAILDEGSEPSMPSWEDALVIHGSSALCAESSLYMEVIVLNTWSAKYD